MFWDQALHPEDGEEMMTAREAIAVQWPEDSQGEALYAQVGKKLYQPDELNEGVVESAGTVTRILVSDDLPGLHCNMERVRVYVGDQVAFEAPVHAVEVIQYRIDKWKGPS